MYVHTYSRCDTYLNKIERLVLSSGTRQLVARNTLQTPVLKPYGLALHEGNTGGQNALTDHKIYCS